MAELELPPRPKDARYQALDAWRGLACLLLVVYHTTFYVQSDFNLNDRETWTLLGVIHKLLTWSFVGVPLFFVISGYCIAASVDGLRRRPHWLSSYLTRRIRRIYPPYWIALVLAVLFATLALQHETLARHCEQLPRWRDLTWTQWLGNFAAIQTWQQHVADKHHYLMENTWTLSYEEQFYLTTALILLASRRKFFVGALVVSLAVLVTRHVTRTADRTVEGFFLDGHWLTFAAGVLVYYACNYGGALWLAGLLLAGMVYAWADRRGLSSPFDRRLDEYVFMAGAFALILIPLKRWDASMSQWSVVRVLKWFGDRSYSIYLVHYPLVTSLSCVLHHDAGWTSLEAWLLGVLPLCFLAMLPAALAFYHGVERHFLNPPNPLVARKPGG